MTLPLVFLIFFTLYVNSTGLPGFGETLTLIFLYFLPLVVVILLAQFQLPTRPDEQLPEVEMQMPSCVVPLASVMQTKYWDGHEVCCFCPYAANCGP